MATNNQNLKTPQNYCHLERRERSVDCNPKIQLSLRVCVAIQRVQIKIKFDQLSQQLIFGSMTIEI